MKFLFGSEEVEIPDAELILDNIIPTQEELDEEEFEFYERYSRENGGLVW